MIKKVNTMLVKRNDSKISIYSVVVFQFSLFQSQLSPVLCLWVEFTFLIYLLYHRTNPKVTLKCTAQAFLFRLGQGVRTLFWGQRSSSLSVALFWGHRLCLSSWKEAWGAWRKSRWIRKIYHSHKYPTNVKVRTVFFSWTKKWHIITLQPLPSS